MALSNSQTRCLGRSDLSPMAPACPKRNDCARCADIAGRDSYAGNPVLPDVQLHLCSDPELSQFVPVEVVGHERNSAPGPDIALSLGLGLRFHPVVLQGDVDSSSAFDAPSAEVCK